METVSEHLQAVGQFWDIANPQKIKGFGRGWSVTENVAGSCARSWQAKRACRRQGQWAMPMPMDLYVKRPLMMFSGLL
ncbi:hypothetical protein LPB41_20855 [Thalassospira sp. MA62]|nr:hypothetical protein [Thalassospira sp. MA62]